MRHSDNGVRVLLSSRRPSKSFEVRCILRRFLELGDRDPDERQVAKLFSTLDDCVYQHGALYMVSE